MVFNLSKFIWSFCKAVIILSERIKFATGTNDGDITKTDIRPICLPKIGHNIKVIGKEALVSLNQIQSPF